MRLGQLARKVAVHPSDIVEFLAKNGVVIDEGTNTRIADFETELVIRRYAPHLLIPDSKHEPVIEEIPAAEIIPSVIAPVSEMETTTLVSETSLDKEEDDKSVAESTETPELIKAAKVELKGLRVIGKIDLPEPKKKEETEEVLTSEPKILSEEPKQRNPKREFPKQQSRRSNKNPVALERERLEKEAEEKKLRKAEEERERRKNYYAKRVKPSAPTKAVRIIDEAVSTLAEEAKEPPKGFLGKFLHWLTS